ncbi:MAG: hypothetical protein ACREL5_09700 [Gemmatimonadales bacterium]
MPAAAACGQAPAPRVEVAAEWSSNPAWSLREATGSFVNRVDTIPAGSGLGLRLGLRVLPAIEAFIDGYVVLRSDDNSDLSGYSAWRAGAEARWPATRRWTPFLRAAIGRLGETGGVSFTQGAFGGGIEFHASRALALRSAGERTFSIGTPAINQPLAPGTRASVDADKTRWILGASLGFGR